MEKKGTGRSFYSFGNYCKTHTGKYFNELDDGSPR